MVFYYRVICFRNVFFIAKTAFVNMPQRYVIYSILYQVSWLVHVNRPVRGAAVRNTFSCSVSGLLQLFIKWNRNWRRTRSCILYYPNDWYIVVETFFTISSMSACETKLISFSARCFFKALQTTVIQELRRYIYCRRSNKAKQDCDFWLRQCTNKDIV